MTDEERRVELVAVKKRLLEKVAMISRAVEECQRRSDNLDELDAYLELDSTLTIALTDAHEFAVGDLEKKLWALWKSEVKRETS